jgi:hypothetical protein
MLLICLGPSYSLYVLHTGWSPTEVYRFHRMRDGARLLYTLVLSQRKANHLLHQPGSTFTPSTRSIFGHVFMMQIRQYGKRQSFDTPEPSKARHEIPTGIGGGWRGMKRDQ